MTHPDHSTSIETFRKALKAKGLKVTGQRLAVHKAMMELGHACAEDVSEKIKADGGRIPTSSVYNILSQMALIGIYKYRFSADNKLYFDVNTSRHAHLYDVYSHEYRDVVLDENLMQAIETSLGKKRFRGYKIDGIDIQIVCHPSHRKAPLSF